MAYDHFTQWLPWIQALLLNPSQMTVTPKFKCAVLCRDVLNVLLTLIFIILLPRKVGFTVPILPLRESHAQ